MTSKNIKIIVCLVVFCLCTTIAFTRQNPAAVYKSKKVYFSKPHPNNGSAEPYKEVENGEGLYTITIYTDHIMINKSVTTDLKIASIKQHKGETKYNLLDSKGRHVELYINGEDRAKKSATINLIEFDNNYVLLGTYMIVCERQ